MDNEDTPVDDQQAEVQPDFEGTVLVDETAPMADASEQGSDLLPDELIAAIEAVLMVAERPIEPRLLAQLVEASIESVEATCADLDATYREQGRGFVLARVAGGYRYQSHPEQAAYVERFVLEGQASRLSAAALETLAIVAYKQPLSRAQVAAIRGVSVDAVMRTLTQRGYIAEVSRDSGPGQAVMYGTTALFLERLNINSIVDLPELGEFVPSADVVEALEHGLRFDADAVTAADDAADETAAAAAGDVGVQTGEAHTPAANPQIDEREPLAEQSADEDAGVIDLRDSTTGFVDPLTSAEGE